MASVTRYSLAVAALTAALCVSSTSAQFQFGWGGVTSRPLQTAVTQSLARVVGAQTASTWQTAANDAWTGAQRAVRQYATYSLVNNAVGSTLRQFGVGTQQKPATVFLPNNRSMMQIFPDLARNISMLPQMIRDSVVQGAWFPRNLSSLRPGTLLNSWNNAPPFVKASAQGTGVLLARNLANRNIQTRVQQIIYRTRYLIIYGVDNLVQPGPKP